MRVAMVQQGLKGRKQTALNEGRGWDSSPFQYSLVELNSAVILSSDVE